jgi:hypothetical protein
MSNDKQRFRHTMETVNEQTGNTDNCDSIVDYLASKLIEIEHAFFVDDKLDVEAIKDFDLFVRFLTIFMRFLSERHVSESELPEGMRVEPQYGSLWSVDNNGDRVLLAINTVSNRMQSVQTEVSLSAEETRNLIKALFLHLYDVTEP